MGDIIEAFKTFFFLYTGSDNDITHVDSQEDYLKTDIIMLLNSKCVLPDCTHKYLHVFVKYKPFLV